MSDLPNLEERRLGITAKQEALLRQAEARIAEAQAYFEALATGIVAGHDLEGRFRVKAIEPDHVLVLELHANGAAP